MPPLSSPPRSPEHDGCARRPRAHDAHADGHLAGPRGARRRAGRSSAAIALSRAVGDSFLIDVVGTAGTLALLIGLAYFIGQLIGLAKRQLLWRVRRKLILSYVFVGLVPALLIITFCLLCGLLLFGTVSQYVVETRLRSGVDQAQFLARSTAMELGRLPVGRRGGDVSRSANRRSLAERNPDASLAIVPGGPDLRSARGPAVPTGRLQPSRTITAGPVVAPRGASDVVPDWVPCGGFAGLVAYAIDAPVAQDGCQRPARVRGRPADVPRRARGGACRGRVAALRRRARPARQRARCAPLERGHGRRAARRHDRVARRRRRRSTRDLARAQCSLAAADDESRFKPPFFVFTEFADWATGRRAGRRCRSG